MLQSLSLQPHIIINVLEYTTPSTDAWGKAEVWRMPDWGNGRTLSGARENKEMRGPADSSHSRVTNVFAAAGCAGCIQKGRQSGGR